MLNILQSMCEGMDDNIAGEAGPDNAGFEEESMEDDESSHEQEEQELEDSTLSNDEETSLDDMRDSTKIRKLKGVSREKLSKEEFKLLQKYGLIENKH